MRTNGVETSLIDNWKGMKVSKHQSKGKGVKNNNKEVKLNNIQEIRHFSRNYHRKKNKSSYLALPWIYLALPLPHSTPLTDSRNFRAISLKPEIDFTWFKIFAVVASNWGYVHPHLSTIIAGILPKTMFMLVSK